MFSCCFIAAASDVVVAAVVCRSHNQQQQHRFDNPSKRHKKKSSKSYWQLHRKKNCVTFLMSTFFSPTADMLRHVQRSQSVVALCFYATHLFAVEKKRTNKWWSGGRGVRHDGQKKIEIIY